MSTRAPEVLATILVLAVVSTMENEKRLLKNEEDELCACAGKTISSTCVTSRVDFTEMSREMALGPRRRRWGIDSDPFGLSAALFFASARFITFDTKTNKSENRRQKRERSEIIRNYLWKFMAREKNLPLKFLLALFARSFPPKRLRSIKPANI